MLGTLLATVAVGFAAPDETIAEGKIIAASLFKNGYAVVVREVPLKGGKAMLDTAPRSSMGTLWFVGADGLEIGSVVNTEVTTKTDTPFSTLDEVLTNNVGKTVHLAIAPDDQILGRIRLGKILSASGQVVMLQSDKNTYAIQKSAIQSVSSLVDGTIKWSREVESKKRVIRLTSKDGKDGKIMMVSLERGLLWAPSYLVDITDPKKLKVLCKATLANDLGELSGIEAKLITGFPNVPYAPFEEPITANMNVDQFVSVLMQAGTPKFARGMAGNALMQQAAPMERARDLSFDQAFQTSPELPGVQLEDLFFYRLPKVELKKGDRGLYYLFAAESEYEHLYTWDIAEPMDQPGDVWNCLKFKNTSGQPWTTAPATTMKDGQVLGQDMMKYTGNGSEGLVKITKAMDVRAEWTEEETARERGAIKNSSGTPIYDLVTIKGTLGVKNRKPEQIKIQIEKGFVGEVVESQGDPKAVKTTKGLKEINPFSNLTWTKTIAAGKDLELTYTYKTYVQSRY